ncbi:MAG: hypothetical protein ACOCUC_00365 [bacterium]
MTISLLFICLTGCGFTSRYNYENIREQYPVKTAGTGQKQVSKNESPRVTQIDGELSLSDAIDIAVKNNPDLQRAAWRIEQSRAMLFLAKSEFWPRASVYTNTCRAMHHLPTCLKKSTRESFRKMWISTILAGLKISSPE